MTEVHINKEPRSGAARAIKWLCFAAALVVLCLFSGGTFAQECTDGRCGGRSGGSGPSGGGGVSGCTTCGCVFAFHGSVGSSCTTRDIVHEEHESTRRFITEEFDDWERFLRDIMWHDFLLPAFQLMAEQLTTTAMHQMLILGQMMDAQHQIETERIFAQLAAKAHREYHPSTSMCVFGTTVRSLASTERNAEFTAYVLAQRSIDRQLGNIMSAGARGQFDDRNFRMVQFKQRYCNPRDNNANLEGICTAQNPLTMNKDIDFTRTIDGKGTLDIDFTEGTTATDDEQDVIALGNNLYGHDLMMRIPDGAIKIKEIQDELLDIRSIVAKRGVAEHSYNNLVGMKAQSSPDGGTTGARTGDYMKVVIKQLADTGTTALSDQELDNLIGERPSYYTQMEVLTKKIYQQPNFFVDLYEQPMNTERKKVAMKAISLMQDFDTWNSYLRTEAMLSIILELELVKAQYEVQGRINRVNSRGPGR